MPQIVNNWCTRENLGMGVINKISKSLPDINRTWLITGDGDMFTKESGIEEKPFIPQNPKNSDDKYIEVIEELTMQNKKSQEQIDRLLTIIEQYVQRN